MGMIVFRRIGGRIVPLLRRTAEREMKLPESVGTTIKNIRFMRTERINKAASPQDFKNKFIARVQTSYMKNQGKKIGDTIAKFVAKRKK